MPREREPSTPVEPDPVKEGRSSEREALRERGLEREEFVTDAYTPSEAVERMPAKRELGDAEWERSNLHAELASLPGVGPETASALARAGFGSVEDVARADPALVADRLFVTIEVAARWVHAARDRS